VLRAANAFEATATLTVALPVPELGESVAQVALLEVTQEQLGPLAMTLMVPKPPLDPNGLPSPEASVVTLQGAGS
jgi:hypothetical protein